TYMVPEAGEYFVEITDGNGCTAVSAPVTVTLNPLPTAVVSGDATICNGESTDLTIELTGAQPWSIEYYDGTTTFTESNITSSPHTISISPTATTYYTLTSVRDINCTGTVSGSAEVIVHELPTAS